MPSREQFQRLALLTVMGLLALLATDRLMAAIASPFHSYERSIRIETHDIRAAADEARRMGDEARRMGAEARRHAERMRRRLEDHREGFRCDVDIEHEFDRDVRVVVR